jgi:murein L,D-transpeptidase YafK
MGCDNIICNKNPGENNKNNKVKIYDEISIKENDTSKETEFFFNVPEKELQQVEIKIFKAKRMLELHGDGEVIGNFKIALGGNPKGDKNIEGDSRTPIGNYYICTRNGSSQYRRFLGISYPNSEDAQRGLNNNLITESVFNSIKNSELNKQSPYWYTPLGGEVGIHGGGNEYDWTLGCIALTNEDIDVIWKYAKLKTPVIIYE